MNHITYQLGLTRRNELLREAADRRRAEQLIAAREAHSSTVAGRKPFNLRRVWIHRSVSQG